MGPCRRPGEPEDQLGLGSWLSQQRQLGRSGAWTSRSYQLNQPALSQDLDLEEAVPFLSGQGLTFICYPTKLDLKYKESDTQKFATANDTPFLISFMKGLYESFPRSLGFLRHEAPICTVVQ